MSRSHLKHSAYSATARVFLRWSTSNYTSVLHYAIILGIVSSLCPAMRSFSLSWTVSLCREQAIAAAKKWCFTDRKKIKIKKRNYLQRHKVRNVRSLYAPLRESRRVFRNRRYTCFEKKYSRQRQRSRSEIDRRRSLGRLEIKQKLAGTETWRTECSSAFASTLVKFPRRTQHSDTKKNSIIAAPVGRPTSSPLASDSSLSLSLPSSLWTTSTRAPLRPLSSGLDPFKWSQCNRTISTPAREHFAPAIGEEITAVLGYLLVTTVTNAVVRRDYSSSSPDNFQVALPSTMSTRCRSHRMNAKNRPSPLLAQTLSRRI